MGGGKIGGVSEGGKVLAFLSASISRTPRTNPTRTRALPLLFTASHTSYFVPRCHRRLALRVATRVPRSLSTSALLSDEPPSNPVSYFIF